jgi:spoIIIJ-associated protein
MAKAKQLNDTDIVKDQLGKLLELMKTSASIESVEEDGENVAVQIDAGEDSGLLIGTHGKTIEALELLSNLMLKNKKGEWRRVTVNIADWKEKEEKRLSDLAGTIATRAVETGKPQYLYNLTSGQRRVIHMLLAENENVETTSDGDGAERFLIVTPKNS